MGSHTLKQLTPHVYWLSPDATTDRPVLGAVAGRERTLIVDAGNSPAHAQLLLQELSKIEIPPSAFVALTHWHWDHVFGTSAFDLPTFAHAETRRMVAEMAQWDWGDEALDRRVEQGVEIAFCRDNIRAELPDRCGLAIRVPEIAFTDRAGIDLGGVCCEVVHVGGDHAADASVVYVAEDRVMFLGDCLGPDLYSGEPSYTTGKLFPLLDRLLSYHVDWYLEAHAPAPISKAGLAQYAGLCRLVGEAVAEVGPDRARLQQRLAAVWDDEVAELADGFLAGTAKAAP